MNFSFDFDFQTMEDDSGAVCKSIGILFSIYRYRMSYCRLKGAMYKGIMWVPYLDTGRGRLHQLDVKKLIVIRGFTYIQHCDKYLHLSHYVKL